MYQCQTNEWKPEQQYFVCSGYRKKKCGNIHSIRNVALEETIIRNLWEAIACVTQYENGFIRKAAETDTWARDKALAQKKDTLAQAEKRITELDATILREFIDKILVSKTSGKRGRGAGDKVQEIEIVYNFIGAFDFSRAIEQTQNTLEIANVGIA